DRSPLWGSSVWTWRILSAVSTELRKFLARSADLKSLRSSLTFFFSFSRDETQQLLPDPNRQTTGPDRLESHEWASWSPCSVTCGEGWQSRSRLCATSSFTTQCTGPLRENRQCNNSVVCPVDGAWDEWTPWSLCSSTCGRGYRDRTRTCKQPQNGGQPCRGPTRQTKFCNILIFFPASNCRHLHTWFLCRCFFLKWVWICCSCTSSPPVSLSRCLVWTVGLFCPCHPRNSSLCTLLCFPLVDGSWNEWSAWSSCSASCSNGTMQRTRECNGPSYGGSECHGGWKETANCFLKDCPVNGTWHPWSSWGSCSKTCGGGIQQRQRVCEGPFFGGEPCPGDTREQKRCNEKRCPGDTLFLAYHEPDLNVMRKESDKDYANCGIC
uniref:Uncharacterized protein n=1 Tax=Poecilia mexicana TaxID=48701 RepID=A0A3B3YGM5_9TELE